MPAPTFEELIEAMKAGAGILQERGIPFALGGGLAAWARGGPRSEHDVDLMILPEQAEDALAAFASAGMRVERPPEGWLVKAWHPNGVLIDLIFAAAGGSLTADSLEQIPFCEVMALRMRVLSPEAVLTSKLLALTEQEPDYGNVLELARALREQIDWSSLRERTEESPFAAAFFTLVERLGIAETTALPGAVVSLSTKRPA
jgi:hypothetical protein